MDKWCLFEIKTKLEQTIKFKKTMRKKSFFLIAGVATLYFNNTYAQTVKDSTKSKDIDEVVVTGVFDKRLRMNSPIAISVLKGDILEKQVPVSASDLLKNVPGVYVNSSNGEIRNSVASRGITVGTQDGSFGYEYVSMQEDGLPITNTTYYNYGPDFFLRADATIERLDAVRGGSSSITTANAPGGIFNYISKTGGKKFEGEARFRTGFQGHDNNGLYRTDLNVGGPLAENLFFNIGGFYRYDEGARSPGDYPLNNGGQIKANIIKKYSTGSLKLFVKYLKDRNGYSMAIPTRGYGNPSPAEGFNNSSSVLLPLVTYDQGNFVEGGNIHYNSRRLVDNTYRSVGLNWEQKLGDGWNLDNKIRVSNNDVRYNSSTNNSIIAADGKEFFNLFGGGTADGTFTFRDHRTGQVLYSINSVNPTGGNNPVYTVTENNLPGQSLRNNGVFISPLQTYENKVKEVLNQLTITKKWNNMNFAFGGYFGYSDVARVSGGGGVAITAIEPNPRILDMEFTGTMNGLFGNYQMTNSDGMAQFSRNNGSQLGFYATQRQIAGFFGHTWDITSALTLDWGIRYESQNIKGHNTRAYLKSTAGPDNNALTMYDNTVLDYLETVDYDRTLEAFSYSAALNYKFNTNLSVYTRFSQGKKSPDLDIYFAANRSGTIGLLDPQQRTTNQLEAGLKAKYNKFDLFVTPFYSVLKNVPSGGSATLADGSFYALPTLYNDFRTVGIEIESNVKPIDILNIRAVVTLQKSKITDGTYWVTNGVGMADDQIASFSGNETGATPRLFFNITPNLNLNKFYTFLTWNYMGKRQANNSNAFTLPAFSMFDLGAGYNFTEKLSASVNVNNLFNTYATMSWTRPGSYADQRASLDNFTPAMYQAAESANMPYFTVANPPRSTFVSVVYKF